MSLSGRDDAPPVHARRTSLFHTLKKSVFSSSEKTIDPAFESAKADFLRLNEYVLKIKSAVGAYAAAMKALFVASKNACDGFSTALEDAPKPHPYEGMMAQTRTTRADVCSDRGEGAVILSLDGSVMKRLNEELDLHKELIVRIGEREHIRAEMDYYAKKVDDLRDDREKRMQKGKDEKADWTEKFDRNERKLRDLRQTYDAFNSLLVHDLQERFTYRVRTLGPAFGDFIGIEKEVLVLYATAVRDLPTVDTTRRDAGADGDFGAADRMHMQKRAAAKMDVGLQSAQVAAQQHIGANLSGTHGMLASYAANSAFNDARSQSASVAAPPPASSMAFSSFSDHHASMAGQFHAQQPPPPPQQQQQHQQHYGQEEFKDAAYPPMAAASASSSSIAAWDAPPMLSHIQDSGVGVSHAVDLANMNTDGSYADPSQFAHAPRKARAPDEPPPVPNQPAFYGGGGGGPISPPGGPAGQAGAGKTFRMDSFGHVIPAPHAPMPPPPPPQPPQAYASRGEGEQSASPPPPRGRPSLNPFDDA